MIAQSIEELTEQRDRLRLQSDVSRMEAEVATLRSLSRRSEVLEAGQIWGSRTEYLRDTPGFNFSPAPMEDLTDRYHVSTIADRLNGRNRPIFETETELAVIRGVSRVIATVDDTSVGALGALTNYTVGTGYTYEATPSLEDSARKDIDTRIANRVQFVLRDWQTRDKWRAKERELVERYRRDGEFFIQIRNAGGCKARTKIVEPEMITEPSNPQQLDEFLGFAQLDWSFGIASEPGDSETVHAYFINWDGAQNWDIARSNELVHAKSNVDGNIKRGLSDYYAIYHKIVAGADIYRKTGKGAANQAAIAFIREHAEGVTGDQVTSWLGSQAHATTSAGTQQVRLPDGAVIDVPAGMKYHAGPMGQPSAPALIEVADAIYRHAGVRWNMPSYMITGDASISSFASTLVSESPFVMSRVADQATLGDSLIEVCWAVVDLAVNGGLFAEFGITSADQLKRIVDIDAKPPRITVRNRLEETQISQILRDADILSAQTWSQNEDLDFDSEQAMIEEHPRPQPSPQMIGQPQQPTMIGETPPQSGELTEGQRLSEASRLLWHRYP